MKRVAGHARFPVDVIDLTRRILKFRGQRRNPPLSGITMRCSVIATFPRMIGASPWPTGLVRSNAHEVTTTCGFVRLRFIVCRQRYLRCLSAKTINDDNRSQTVHPDADNPRRRLALQVAAATAAVMKLDS
ncbi:hypothetical protein GOOTI_202_00650 [Gordonia otitidis NBRC 100426]|uniref:Uncharacterized protein n=1 Tax=Gordonia otitidis (strain DSM 44809 / CCUG 52243 / JCM 12355 / NBRC 100426 / IFM 10032) TaxID=1108044 RepID=H5TRV1_GORO1|nr:hypothetical protein GOOTI_202_00650 [Gordonia otitidis NBRC 100426]